MHSRREALQLFSGAVLLGCSGQTTDPYRTLDTNGLPDHETGTFPNPGCPFPISAHQREYRVTRRPNVTGVLTALNFWEFGLATNGVPFDPCGPHYGGDDTNDWAFEVTSPVASPHLGVDLERAHSNPFGMYHYHALPPIFLERAMGSMKLLGWAADGFPVYAPFGHSDPNDLGSPLVTLRASYRLKDGLRAAGGPGGKCDGTMVSDYAFEDGLGDLDETNGRFGATPEFPNGTYHYVLTDAFPFIPRAWRGTPDPSFKHDHGPGLDGLPPALRDYHG
jgi:hypothetical protein